jgi:hypothetical protein
LTSASRKLSNAFAINTGVAWETLPTSSSVRIILLILACYYKDCTAGNLVLIFVGGI